MKRIRVPRSAQADLDDIWAYTAERRGVDAAQRLIETLADTFGLLSKNPRAGRSRDDLSPGLRSFAVDRHRVYYRVDAGAVRVSYVRHSARDEPELLS